MGCVCAKEVGSEEREESRQSGRQSRLLRRVVASSRRDDVVVPDAGGIAGDDGSRGRAISKELRNAFNAPAWSSPDGGEAVAVGGDAVVVRKEPARRRRAVVGAGGNDGDRWLGIESVKNGFKTEHVAAGWPLWLVAVAEEAVKGWLPLKAEDFEMFEKIGQGTYSIVYRARGIGTGKCFALKKVRFVKEDAESIRFMAREINILRRLDHPNVVKLEGLIASQTPRFLYLVFEYLEHDLTGLAANPSIEFTEPQIKCYMQQLLRGLDHCHSHGVLHRDIKGSNILINNSGILKIADFGLATFFDPGQQQKLTTRVVTLWYRPPELLLGATEYDHAVDLWSAGCILAELYAGKPIMPGRTEVEQLHKIFKLCGSPSEEYWKRSSLQHATTFKLQDPYRRRLAEMFTDLPSPALVLLDSLLAVEPEHRGTAASALLSEFFTTEPLSCDPSSLPKYPPSKEQDAKLREEARRQRGTILEGRGSESGSRTSRESKAMPMPDANAGLQASLQKRLVHVKSISNTEKYTRDKSTLGFPIDPPRGAENTRHHSGPVDRGVFESSWNNHMGARLRLTPNRSSSTLGASNSRQSRTQRSFHGVDFNISNFSASTSSRHTASSRYKYQHDVPQLTERSLDRPSPCQKKNERSGSKEPTTSTHTKNRRILYSGPLMRQGDTSEEMLKEQERLVQKADCKARIDKTKNKNNGENGHFEASNYHGRSSNIDT